MPLRGRLPASLVLATLGARSTTKGVIPGALALLALGASGLEPVPPAEREGVTVEVVPPIIHSSPGTRFRLDALARDVAHTPLGEQPANVKWTGGVEFSSPTTATTTVTAPTSNVTDIRVTMGGTESPRASVIVASRAGPVTDELTLPVDPLTPVPVALIDAMPEGKSCDDGNDQLYRVAGTAQLELNLTTGCANKLTVFAVGHGVLFECSSAPSPVGAQQPAQTTSVAANCDEGLKDVWTAGPDKVSRNPLPGTLNVKLSVWYRVKERDPQSEGAVDAGYATDIYRMRRAGMTFQIDPATGGADGGEKVYVPADDKCTGIEAQLGFTPSDDAVNVIYVQEILISTASIRGLMCTRGSSAPIVVVSWDRKSPTTLAHEMAHVMSLSSEVFTDPPYGHTLGLREFDESNLMSQFENATIGVERDYLTLGQGFRVHVDERSWANRGKIRSGATERCQPIRLSSAPCPKLNLDVGAR